MIIKKRYMDKESYIKAEEEIRRTLNGIKYIMDEGTNEELIYTKEDKMEYDPIEFIRIIKIDDSEIEAIKRLNAL
jgi:hypothetical protein